MLGGSCDPCCSQDQCETYKQFAPPSIFTSIRAGDVSVGEGCDQAFRDRPFFSFIRNVVNSEGFFTNVFRATSYCQNTGQWRSAGLSGFDGWQVDDYINVRLSCSIFGGVSYFELGVAARFYGEEFDLFPNGGGWSILPFIDLQNVSQLRGSVTISATLGPVSKPSGCSAFVPIRISWPGLCQESQMVQCCQGVNPPYQNCFETTKCNCISFASMGFAIRSADPSCNPLP